MASTSAAGTLFGLGLSQQLDENGKPMSGAKLYITAQNTTTAVDVFKDTGLTQLHPHPIVADANGRIPAFWVPSDIYYGVRLTDKNDVEQFDEPSVLAIGQPAFVAPPPPPIPIGRLM